MKFLKKKSPLVVIELFISVIIGLLFVDVVNAQISCRCNVSCITAGSGGSRREDVVSVPTVQDCNSAWITASRLPVCSNRATPVVSGCVIVTEKCTYRSLITTSIIEKSNKAECGIFCDAKFEDDKKNNQNASKEELAIECYFGNELVYSFTGKSKFKVGGNDKKIESPTEPSAAGAADLVGNLQSQISALNKLGPGATPQQFIGRIIKIVMGVIGSVALLIFVFGGIMWMTARGNSEQVAKATKTLAWAALGVVVILASYVIVQFIFGVF